MIKFKKGKLLNLWRRRTKLKELNPAPPPESLFAAFSPKELLLYNIPKETLYGTVKRYKTQNF